MTHSPGCRTYRRTWPASPSASSTLLRSAGLSEPEAALAHHALDDLVTGSGLFLAVAPELADPEERAEFRRYTAGLPADEYPTSVAIAGYMFGDVDDVFEFQLELLLDGIEHRTREPKEPQR